MEITLTTLEPAFAAKVDAHVKETTAKNKKIAALPHILQCSNCYLNALKVFWVLGETNPVLQNVPAEILLIQTVEQVVEGKLIDGNPYIILEGKIVSMEEIPNLIQVGMKPNEEELAELMAARISNMLEHAMRGQTRANDDDIPKMHSMFGGHSEHVN